MHRMLPALCLTVAVLPYALAADPAAAQDQPGVAASWTGDYGDAEGRLRCAEDGEFLRFEPDGQVLLFGGGQDGQPIGAWGQAAEGDLVLRVADGQDTIDFLLTPDDSGALAITGALMNGTPDPALLEEWQTRHGAWVPCPQ